MPNKNWHPLDRMAVAKTVGLTAGVIHTVGVLLLMATNGALIEWVQAWHGLSGHAWVGLDATNLVVGIIAALVVGAAVGWVFATIWNKVGKL